MSIAFNESYYLQNNPDVLKAISLQQIGSALEHFQKYGGRELRNPNAVFDSKYYAERNPDVLSAVNKGAFNSVYDHFAQYGVYEGRIPNASLETFNASSYLAANPDVNAALTSGAVKNALQHYVMYGIDEGRVSTTSGTTFTLTAATVNLNNSTSNVGTDKAGTKTYLSVNADKIEAGTFLSSAVIISDGSTSDNDILNGFVNSNIGAPVLQNIETLNLQAFGGTMSFGAVSGAKTITISGTSFTATGLQGGSLDPTALLVAAPSYTLNGVTGAQVYTLQNDGLASNVLTLRLQNLTTGSSIAYGNATGLEVLELSTTGANATTLGALNTAAATVNILGTGSLTLTDTANGAVGHRINASTYSGTLAYVDGGVSHSVTGSAGADTFTFTGAGTLTAADTIDGGAGTDALTTTNWSGTNDLDNVTNVETITLNGANVSFNYVAKDALVTAGTVLTVNASGSTGTSTLTWNGSAETNGSVNITGTANNDSLLGGIGSDTLTGGAGADTLEGGLGVDSITVGSTGDAFGDRVILNNITLETNRDVIAGFTAGVSPVGDVAVISSLLTTVGTAAGLNAVVGADSSVAGTGGGAYVIGAVTSANSDIIALQSGTTLTSGTMGGDLSASINGTELLKALTNGGAADSYTQITAAGAGHSTYLLAYQNGNAYLYLASDAAAAGGNNDGAWQAAEIHLIGTFTGITANALINSNFVLA
ncbi:beta strand repeat-containing protein [Elstera cyanobacteriorum]|uniref:beta strand repeat-containing protein n=1 Tax=Elstera cyanobacteriorum TaxID=2022747 RepID=UPI002356B67C|nr:hypothetical protein [Elstera cyanobacteriorum]MCK6441256.1 hypothetical protein [Elstera cyanobacteriorum]